MKRRKILKSSGVLLGCPLAGCAGSDEGPGTTRRTTGRQTSTDTFNHPGEDSTESPTSHTADPEDIRAEFVMWSGAQAYGLPEPDASDRVSLATFKVHFSPRFTRGTDATAAIPFDVKYDEETGEVVLVENRLGDPEFMRIDPEMIPKVLSAACSLTETSQALAMVEVDGVRDGEEGTYRAVIMGACENALPPEGHEDHDERHEHRMYETFDHVDDREITEYGATSNQGHVFIADVGWSQDWETACVSLSDSWEKYPQGGRGLYYSLNSEAVAPMWIREGGGTDCPEDLSEDQILPKCDFEYGDYDPLTEPEFFGSGWSEADVLTPIASSRGHFKESDWTTDNYLTEGHTEYGYDTTGNTPIVDEGGQPEKLVIYVHGHANDDKAAVENFNQAARSLREYNDYDGEIVGYSWDSDVGKNEFSDSDWRATKNGPKLGHYIASLKCRSPSTDVHIVTHSLGARVALEAIQWLYNEKHWSLPSTFSYPDGEIPDIESVHLMGAAIETDAIQNKYFDTVANKIGHLYIYVNHDDPVLYWAYDTGVGDPLGQAGPTGDLPDNTTSFDVTEEVGDNHSNYNAQKEDSAGTGGRDGIMDLVLAHLRQ